MFAGTKSTLSYSVVIYAFKASNYHCQATVFPGNCLCHVWSNYIFQTMELLVKTHCQEKNRISLMALVWNVIYCSILPVNIIITLPNVQLLSPQTFNHQWLWVLPYPAWYLYTNHIAHREHMFALIPHLWRHCQCDHNNCCMRWSVSCAFPSNDLMTEPFDVYLYNTPLGRCYQHELLGKQLDPLITTTTILDNPGWLK